MMYVRFPLSIRNVEDLLYERGVDVNHEAVRFWWRRFGGTRKYHTKADGMDERAATR